MFGALKSKNGAQENKKEKVDNLKFTKFLIILLVPYSFSCSALNEGIAAIRNPKGFSDIGENVFIEDSSDKSFGKRIKDLFPTYIDSVERKQFQKISKMMPTYLCHTDESFYRYTGSKRPGPRVKVTSKHFYISPRLEPSQDCYDIIYHELSHIVMIQNLGLYRHFLTPVWFHEGLATYVANGGGSGNVSDSTAISEILKGNHFYPLEKDNILFQNSFKNELAPWMNYRQSMIFVKYMLEKDKVKFRQLIENINKRIAFKKAFENAYGISVQEMWNAFLVEIKRG